MKSLQIEKLEVGQSHAVEKPAAWWIPKAEQFSLPPLLGERPFAKAWEPLYTRPAPSSNANQLAVPAWVSVSERMPERVDVLVYSPDLRNPCDQLVGRFMDGRWYCAGYEMLNVTHWMPLPSAPELTDISDNT